VAESSTPWAIGASIPTVTNFLLSIAGGRRLPMRVCLHWQAKQTDGARLAAIVLVIAFKKPPKSLQAS
jgi:hypothetical protein